MNTISTRTYRDKYRLAVLDGALRNAMVAEKVCAIDRSDNKNIQNPYGGQPTATVQALAGTYSVSAFTTTNESLDVDDEIIYSEHIFDFEQTLSRFDLFASRTNEVMYAVAIAADKWAVNELCEGGTGAYTTPVGGFTTAANINVIISNLISKVAGYAETYYGNMYLIIEDTDVPGFIQAAATSGFKFADDALKNGLVGRYMGVDVFVVKSGTFVDEATTAVSGSKTWTNDSHRVFGVKKVTTFAQPRDHKIEEKSVTGKTGIEFVIYGYVGFKVWSQKAALTVDITLA